MELAAGTAYATVNYTIHVPWTRIRLESWIPHPTVYMLDTRSKCRQFAPHAHVSVPRVVTRFWAGVATVSAYLASRLKVGRWRIGFENQMKTAEYSDMRRIDTEGL